jgi:hypothetical protein
MTTKKPDFPAFPEPRWTRGDVRAHIDNLTKGLREAGLLALVEQLRKMAIVEGVGPTVRFPFSLDSATPIDRVGRWEVKCRPQLPCRPTHIVLTPETARGFKLLMYQVGCEPQSFDCGELGLDCFSIEYAGNAQLEEVLQWRGGICPVGAHIGLLFERRNDRNGPLPFRGLLWCNGTL